MPLYEGIGLINEKLAVVLEIGRSLTKAGFAGENSPRCIIPSVCPGTKDVPLVSSIENKDTKKLYGDLVEFLRNVYFRHLLVTPKERKVVIIESLFCPTIWKETLARVLYLHFEILNVLWIPCHLAGVCGTGGETALVLDVGAEEAMVVPVVNGITCLSATVCHELGAVAFDRNLKDVLLSNCINACDKAADEALSNAEVLEDIRLRTCFISPRPAASHPPNSKLKQFEIERNSPSRAGTTVYLDFKGIARVEAGEFWFQNDELDGISLPNMILCAISKAPIDARKTLASSILLCGGSTMIPGFRARLLYDLKNQASSLQWAQTFNPSYEFRIFTLPCPQNCVNWFGGSVYGSSEAMNLRGTSKEYYLRTGNVPDWSSASAPIGNQIPGTSPGSSRST